MVVAAMVVEVMVAMGEVDMVVFAMAVAAMVAVPAIHSAAVVLVVVMEVSSPATKRQPCRILMIAWLIIWTR